MALDRDARLDEYRSMLRRFLAKTMTPAEFRNVSMEMRYIDLGRTDGYGIHELIDDLYLQLAVFWPDATGPHPELDPTDEEIRSLARRLIEKLESF